MEKGGEKFTQYSTKLYFPKSTVRDSLRHCAMLAEFYEKLCEFLQHAHDRPQEPYSSLSPVLGEAQKLAEFAVRNCPL